MSPDDKTARVSRMKLPARGIRRSVTGLLAATVVLFGMTAGANAVGKPGEPPAGTAQFDRQFTHGRVAVDGGNIHYVRGGSGPALVLLHGWPQTWYEWNKVMPALARKHTVIAMDLPGLGDSSVPESGYDKATTAKRIHQAVNKLGFTKAEVMGHDIGALVAYAYARDYPSEVTRVAVVDLNLSGFGLEDAYSLSWHFLFNMSPAPIPETIMDNEDVRTYLSMPFDLGSHHKEAVERSVYFQAYADPAHRTGGYNYYRAFPADAADNKANAVTKRLTMPVLAMGGQFGFGTWVADSFRQVAGDVREVIVPDSGHFVPEENPAFLTDCVNYFFGATPGTPTRPDLAGCAA